MYAQERSGSAAAGWMALLLLVPLVVAAPFAGRAFSGPDPERVLGQVFVVRALTLALAAALAAVETSVVLLAIPAAVAIGGVAFVRPGQAVIAPGTVRTARELTTANLVVGSIDATSVLLGPILATACLALGGAPTVLALCGGFAVLGALAVSGDVHRRTARRAARRTDRSPATRPTPVRDRPGTATGATPPVDARTSAGLRATLRELRGRDHVVSILTVFTLQHVFMGVVGLMFVVLAVDELDMGSSGAGLLNIAFGVGAVASSIGSSVLAARGRLAPTVVGAAVLMAGGALAVGLVVEVAAASVGLAVAGFARSLLDVSARMLLQRSVPADHLAGTFAIIEVLTSVGLAIGTVCSQLAVATIGAPAGLVVCAAVVLTVVALTAAQVWRADRSADVPLVAITPLRSMPVFAPLPPATLELVARASHERTFAPGSVLMRQGEPGDVYHAVAGGEVEVDVDGRTVRRLGRGAGVGEVALLTDGPRTATVTAVQRTVTLEIAREQFLLAVTGDEAAMHAVRRDLDGFAYPDTPDG